MAAAVAGIDPHQDSFTVGVVEASGVERCHSSFPNSAVGYCAAIEMLSANDVKLVGIEGSASWGSHVALAIAGAGFDAREVPPQRSSRERRARRLAKTDAIDAISTARALQAEPDLGPVQVLQAYDPLVAKIEAVLEHRRALVNLRTLALHYVQDQLAKLPASIRDVIGTHGKIEARLRRLELVTTEVESSAGRYRHQWLLEFLAQDRAWAKKIRDLEDDLSELLDTHGTTLRDEDGIGAVAAATLITEVGDPRRFRTEAKFARWCGTGAVALSSGEGGRQPKRHRLDFGGNRRVNSMIYMMSVTQQRYNPDGRQYLERKLAEGKTRREARRAHKRHLANRIIRRMWKDEKKRAGTPAPTG